MNTTKTDLSWDNFNPEHAKEFKDSAIDIDIALANFKSFDGNDENERDEIFTYLIEEPKHSNNGTLASSTQNNLANAIYGGGWLFQGHKGIGVKLNNPRINSDGKVIKYESVRGEQQVLIPHVTWGQGQSIVKDLIELFDCDNKYLEAYIDRFNEQGDSSIDTGFWDWFLSTDLPLVLTEGIKKACCLISNGYPAIALNGIYGFGKNELDMFGEVEKDDDGKNIKAINPDLLPFLKGRDIYIVFDNDDKPKTKKNVETAKRSIARTIGSDANVFSVTWEGDLKGIDDYVFKHGKDYLVPLFEDAKAVNTKIIKVNKNMESATPEIPANTHEIITKYILEDRTFRPEVLNGSGS